MLGYDVAGCGRLVSAVSGAAQSWTYFLCGWRNYRLKNYGVPPFFFAANANGGTVASPTVRPPQPTRIQPGPAPQHRPARCGDAATSLVPGGAPRPKRPSRVRKTRRSKKDDSQSSSRLPTSLSQQATLPFGIHVHGERRLRHHARVCDFKSSRSTNSSAEMCVASRTPAVQRRRRRLPSIARRTGTNGHPDFNPGSQMHGTGVVRSLPRDMLNRRNGSVISAQTKCKPTSPAPVLQQPSR